MDTQARTLLMSTEIIRCELHVSNGKLLRSYKRHVREKKDSGHTTTN